MNSLTLSHEDLKLVVLPDCGGAIVEIFLDGIQIMARPPKVAERPVLHGDEVDWVRAWNGGWQPLLPNAGSEFVSGEFPQGFHGNASQAIWKIARVSPTDIDLQWSEEDLYSSRSIDISTGQIVVSGKIVNLANHGRHLIVTEHVIFGDFLFTSDAKLSMSDKSEFMELEYDGTAGEAEYRPWSEVSKSDWSTVGLNTPARMGVISNIDSGGVEITGELIKATLTWDTDNLPHAWLWEEMRASQDNPWNGEYTAFGLEPSTTPHGAGLGEGIRTGTTKFLNPQEEFQWWVVLKLERIKSGAK